MARAPKAPPSIEEEEPVEDDFEDRAFDPSAASLVDEEGNPLDPTQAGEWLSGRLGGHGIGNPHPQNTKIRTQLAQTPVAACAVEGAYQYQVEKTDPASGDAHIIGTMPLTTTMPEFVRRFIDAMPEEGDDAAEFFFTPLNKAGVKVGVEPGKPYAMVPIPWHHIDLKRAREQQRKVAGDPQAMLLQMLQQQVRDAQNAAMQARAEAAAAAARAETAREEAAKERLAHAQTMGADISQMYQKVGTAQTEMLSGAAKSIEERAKTEREERRADAEERVKLARAEADAKVEAIKAEANARAEAAKLEIELKVKQMEADAKVRIAELELKAAEAKAKVEAERLQYEKDRDRDDKRWAQERADAEKRRQDERDADQKRADAEQKRADAHALSMEKIRTDAMALQQRAMDNERAGQKEYLTLMVGLLEKQQKAESGGKFGVVGEVLNALGMTPMEALEKGRELLNSAGTGGLAETIAKGIFDLGQEIVKRLPAAEEGDEEEEEGEEEEEEEETRQIEEKRRVEAETAPQKKKRDPVPLETFLEKSSAEPLKEATLPPPPAISLEEVRQGRAAVESLVQRLAGTTINGWGAAIASGKDIGDFVRYVQRVGLDRAMEGQDVDVEGVAMALEQLGLFEGPVPREGAKS